MWYVLSDDNLFDDAFKNENKALFDELDSINQQLKNTSDETKKDLNDKRLELQSSIASKWQDKNIKINKQNIFKIVNSLSDLPQEYKYLENNFKNVNFTSQSILIINGLSYRTGTPNKVVKGLGYWINKFNVNDKKINIEYKFKEIKTYGESEPVSPVISGIATVHFIITEKITKLSWL